MKTICLDRTRCLTALAFMLVGVLLTCYSAIGNLGQGGMQDIENIAHLVPADEDGDAEYLEKRHEFMDRFFGAGSGGVSPGAYMAALDEARALPPSRLLQGQRFVSPEALEVTAAWSSPIAPPIQNSYGGNASARVQTLAIDPINANVVYTGSFGGLAKTTDGGVTWRYLSDAWASQSISAIVVDPNASNDVYVGTGNSYGPYGVGLYRSFDGGSTWSSPLGTTQLAGTYMRTIAIDPNTSGSQSNTTVYVANGCADPDPSHCPGNYGLWRSTNSGSTWTRLRQGQPSVTHGIYDVAIDSSTHPSTLYVTEDDGTFKSTDSGQSWISIHDVLQGSRNRLSVVNSMLYLLGPGDPDQNLYKSIDRGATWIQIPMNCFPEAMTAAPTPTVLASRPSPWIPPIHRSSSEATWPFTAPTTKA